MFRNFPITELHPHTEQAAEAAEAAGAQGKFWQAHDRLLLDGAALDRRSLERMARDIKLDAGAFAEALDDHRFLDRIRRDVDEGVEAGVNSTPKFFINGARIDGRTPLENLDRYLHEALAAADRPPRAS